MVGIQGIDTRALTRHLRDKGAQNGIISTVDLDHASLVAKARAIPSMAGLDLASGVSCDKPYHWTEGVWDLESGYPQVDPCDAEVQGRGLRFRHQVQHPALPGGCRLRCDGGAGQFPGRGGPGHESGRHLPQQRPGRPGAAGRGAGRNQEVCRQDADLRHLPGTSAARTGPGRHRPSSCPSATTAPTCRSWTCPPARWRSPPRTTALPSTSIPWAMPPAWAMKTSTTRPWRGSTTAHCRSSPCSTIPRHRRDRMIPSICSGGSWR